MVISIVGTEKNILLMALPVPFGCYREELVEELLVFVNGLLRVKLVLFDRGFVNKGLIHILQDLNLNYLIFAKKYEELKCMFESVEECTILEHEMRYSKDKSTFSVETYIAMIKEGECDWVFYTNLMLDDAKYYVRLYKKRWGIETYEAIFLSEVKPGSGTS